MQQIKIFSRRSPAKLLVLGFLVIIFLGTGMLMLPVSTINDISFTDALFMSTSAVCVTGLIVMNTGADFTFFGKTVILFLIQVGGLGYMSMATLIALLLGKKIGISERFLLKESLNISTLESMITFMKRILVFVFGVELAGALALTVRFAFEMPLGEALASGIFHSVSAFNNAGFSIYGDSFISYRGDVFTNLILMLLIVSGGLGFVVVLELYRGVRTRNMKLSFHSLIVLYSTVLLIAMAATLIFFSERQYFFQSHDVSMFESWLTSLFASITARTAGFNTVDYSLMQPATLFLTMALMIVGGSPGSTAGGIKTTTFSVIMMHLWCTIRGRADTVIFRRRIPEALVSRSLVILALALIYTGSMTFILMDVEHTKLVPTLFEVVSAFGTVGLSTGDGGTLSLSSVFSSTSKGVIIFTMLLGRVGPLTLFAALLSTKEARFRYPEGRVMIG